MLNALEVLTKAREIISDKSRWTQGTCAVTRTGRGSGPYSDDAYRFCALGAMYRAAGVGRSEEVKDLAGEMFGSAGHLTLINDRKGYEVVLGALDDAIARLTPVEVTPEPVERELVQV